MRPPKITTDSLSLDTIESDLDILLRERLIKYLISVEPRDMTWDKEDRGGEECSIYTIRSEDGQVCFRYKIGILDIEPALMTFRLCNVGFSKNKRRKGILTDMMHVVEELAPHFGIRILQVECPNTEAIQSWLRKYSYEEHGRIWEKKL